MKTETTLQGIQAALRSARNARKSIGFVPTMGNLHAGHIQLVAEAKRCCDVVVVSVFVNPTQFGAGEDFDRYPRTLEADQQLLVEVGCDLLFAPTVNQMYSALPQRTIVQVTGESEGLCGDSRPGHFDGVATVVTKLFNIVQPDLAFFGQKDYQQLAVIRRLTRDLCFPIEIVGVPTVRAADGLALSSRNGFLDAVQRRQAPALFQALQNVQQALQSGQSSEAACSAQRQWLGTQGFEVDYLEVRNPLLEPLRGEDTEAVVLVAARLGSTRLIDNLTFARSGHETATML